VPAIVDVPSRTVVTNDFPRITEDLFFEWRDHHRDGAPDLWPAAVRDEMDEMDEVMDAVFRDVNDGTPPGPPREPVERAHAPLLSR
jgi:putative glutathione S-transferase